MLVLSRRSGEGIKIDDHIKIHVVQIGGSRVSIAIDAPKEISVHRDEINRAIRVDRSRRAADAPLPSQEMTDRADSK